MQQMYNTVYLATFFLLIENAYILFFELQSKYFMTYISLTLIAYAVALILVHLVIKIDKESSKNLPVINLPFI